MISCPKCKQNTLQAWYRYTPSTPEAPAEAAHYECGYWLHCYDQDPGAEIDAKYDSMSN